MIEKDSYAYLNFVSINNDIRYYYAERYVRLKLSYNPLMIKSSITCTERRSGRIFCCEVFANRDVEELAWVTG